MLLVCTVKADVWLDDIHISSLGINTVKDTLHYVRTHLYRGQLRLYLLYTIDVANRQTIHSFLQTCFV